MKLSDEQQHIADELLKFNKQIVRMGGTAGSGKSFLVHYLSQILTDFAVCAFTGKAAHVLRQRGVNAASTIHKIIYKPFTDYDGKVYFGLVGKNEIGFNGFIVDEASMISKDIYQDLLSFDLPIIFVGDHAQLEPVGQDVYLMKDPDYKLETIHRNAGEIAHFCHWIRNGYAPNAFQYQKEYKGKVKFLQKHQASKNYLNVDQIICAYNKTRVEINQEIRKQLNRDSKPSIDDNIICLRNVHQVGVFNGMQGRIKDIEDNMLVFESDEDNVFCVPFDRKQFNQEKYNIDFERDAPIPFDYGYCLTCHKCQGSEFPKTMVIEQKCKLWSHERWCYTAASRAKEEIFWISP